MAHGPGAQGSHLDHRGGARSSTCAWPTSPHSGSHSINGVAKLHTELIKQELLPDFYELFPERFNNKTNGVTPRRWLLDLNPNLVRLLSERLGLRLARPPARRRSTRPRTLRRRTSRKRSSPSSGKTSADSPATSSMDRPGSSMRRRCSSYSIQADSRIQATTPRVPRAHRALLAAKARIDPGRSDAARVHLWGKAAPGYTTAKTHIRLINDIAEMVNADTARQRRRPPSPHPASPPSPPRCATCRPGRALSSHRGRTGSAAERLPGVTYCDLCSS